MGLTILPIRTKSIGTCVNDNKCPVANKKIQDTQRKAVLAYPSEHILMTPILNNPPTTNATNDNDKKTSSSSSS